MRLSSERRAEASRSAGSAGSTGRAVRYDRAVWYDAVGRSAGCAVRTKGAGGVSGSAEQAALQLGAEVGGQDAACAVDEERHLVADEADVALGVGEYGERGAVGDGHDEHEAAFHLDDGLVDASAFEDAGGSGGQ